MTDLEMTKLCAEAMGFHIELETRRVIQVREIWHTYNPLDKDEQAMELVKRFNIDCDSDVGMWECFISGHSEARNPDLNRAIVECCAKMHASNKIVVAI